MTNEERLQLMREINEELLRWLQPINLEQYKKDNPHKVELYRSIGLLGMIGRQKKKAELERRRLHNERAKRYYEK